ncbi:MAG: zinc ABC transporter substrate-binding protein [Magnetococcales bacterium]|nr:zinc ABC transporter substrate-binding protein [Magnetococcales bacterium]
MFINLVRFVVCCSFFWSFSFAQAENISVVATISPIHSLVAGVMQGRGEPHLLVKGSGSPHTYNLRPSDVRALNNAHIVFWVGPTLESFLTKTLQGLGEEKSMMLFNVPGVKPQPNRDLGAWLGDVEEEHGHDDHYHDEAVHDEHGHEAHHHDHEGMLTDMHVWLDPQNAKAITSAISRKLSALDPDNAALYQQNATNVLGRISRLHRGLLRKMKPLRTRAYVVFHDAYHHFEARYGLSPVGAVAVSPDRKPGAKRLHQIQQRIKQSATHCLFSEPQFSERIVTAIAGDTGIKSAVLDPLGTGIKPGPDAYFEIMNALGDSLAHCLGE